MTDKGYKILVVDDDLEMCGLLSDVLKEEGILCPHHWRKFRGI